MEGADFKFRQICSRLHGFEKYLYDNSKSKSRNSPNSFASNLIERVMCFVPSLAAYGNAADLSYQIKDLPSAIAGMEKAVRLFPGSPAARLDFARYYKPAGMRKEANKQRQAASAIMGRRGPSSQIAFLSVSTNKLPLPTLTDNLRHSTPSHRFPSQASCYP